MSINKNNDTQFVCVMTQVILQLRAEITKERDDMYSSYCPALDVFSQGSTEKAAKDNLSEVVQLTIEMHLEDGTFAKWMKKCGFRSTTDNAFMWALANKKVAKAKKSALAPKTAMLNVPVTLPPSSVAAHC